MRRLMLGGMRIDRHAADGIENTASGGGFVCVVVMFGGRVHEMIP